MRNAKFTLFLSLSLLVGQVQASCYSNLKSLFVGKTGFNNNEAIDFTERVTRIENFTNFLRKGKEDPTPALNLKIAKKINLLHENIFANNFSANEREWRTFFRTIEAQLIGVKRYKKISDFLAENEGISEPDFIKALESMDFNSEFVDFIKKQVRDFERMDQFKSKLQEEINKSLVLLGNKYQEYRMVRGSLEDLLKSKQCNDTCKKQVKLLMDNLGANSEKETLAHPTFFKDQVRPSIDELRKMLYQEPLFVLTKAKKERNTELKSFLLSYLNQPQFVDRILGLIYKSDTIGRRKAVQLFKLIYDSHARNVYFPKLNKIIFSTDSAKINTQVLQGQNATVDQDELLVTFARRLDALAQEKWKEIKAYAEKFEKEFFKRMEDAEKKAQARGTISPTKDNTLLMKVALLTGAGAGAYAYFYFDGTPTSIEIEIEENEVPIPSSLHDSKEEGDQKILLDGEFDQMLDEASEVIYESDTARGPSSLKQKKDRGNIFRELWCSIFTCNAHE
ncbi:MAG: hypothetical protein CME60_02080 [Halobacteriovoraceae bacterium]|nr:hypothetical protein [Halobacteriovoraceae bacterium]